MTITAESFEISRVIRAMFGQLKNMMAMTVDVLNLFIAFLADAFVTGVNELLERQPKIDRHTRIPGETEFRKFFYRESSHILPCQTPLRLAKPEQASPCHPLPHPYRK